MPEIITVSYSEIDTARQCAFKHELAYKERWVSPTTSPALARGTAWHSMLEAHYLEKKRQEDEGEPVDLKAMESAGLAALRTAGMPEDEEDLLRWMYDGYIRHYGCDPQWKIMAVEYAPVVPLRNERGHRSRFHLKLKIDLVVWDREYRRLVLIDHKSGKDLPKDKELDIDDQFGLYTWAMRQLGKPVFQSIHSAARTQRNKDPIKHPQPLDERFRRTPLYRTDKELTALALDAYRQARNTYAIRIGLAPRSPNPDTCKWKCGFTEPCLAGRKGMDHRGMLEGMGFVQDFRRH